MTRYLDGLTWTLHAAPWTLGALTPPTLATLLWRTIRRPLDRTQLTLRAHWHRHTHQGH